MNPSLLKPDTVYTVSQITELIKLELETAFPVLWVEGEISNFHRHSSGHLYFTLKDEKSQLSGVMWRSEARRLRFEVKDGLKVVCKGRINVYEPRGQYQLVADLVEPKGKGALQLAFEQLREKLRAEGLFDPKYKKKLPLLPKKIGIVTSPRGAAVVDILRILERRFARLHILIYPVKVQGEGAADEIVEGIDYFAGRADIDVMIVGRGGGSVEDLWAFNDEKVARAIFRSPVPTISAVGHEVDFTIADFVADVRAATPSAAAEMVVEKEDAFQEKILNFGQRLAQVLMYRIQEKKNEVAVLAHHRIFQNFRIRVLNLAQKADELEIRAWNMLRSEKQSLTEMRSQAAVLWEKLRRDIPEKIRRLRIKWEMLDAGVQNLSPLNILKKGYALCWRDGGLRLVRKPAEVAEGEEITVAFYKGELTCRVKSIDKAKPFLSRFIEEDR
jgi:exodeoxyribonuclease VII large subunit